ncbi:uncharacterized protein LOC100902642 [Galendromus occidentalis]|uniref:Uncharacterized protein LOC100902642 n=1 Tax=Galendromus occidentalis TaxID=34638 RepID=A0AAJ7L497_9ACAR|nr:uncharacterized protein LOC100902642 [Galendromus occidentalis]
MGEIVFACACLNVELRCPEASAKSLRDEPLESVFGENLCYLAKPQKRVTHDWLLREKRCGENELRHCAACNALVFAIQGQDFVVPQKLKRSDKELDCLRQHNCFSECLQIIIDPSSTLLQRGLIDTETARKDSLVPGYLQNVRLKMIQVVKQVMTEKHRIIEEQHRRALEQWRALQSKCDYQCNTLLKIIEYQESAEERRFSSATTKSCSSVRRSESTESKASLLSSKEPALDDDVFEMQFNDEAIYEDDSRTEPAEEARELSGTDDEDEGVSTTSQERTQKSDMDLSQYATSLPIEVPKEASNWQGLRLDESSRSRLEQSPVKPEFEDIARSMKDLSDRMMDDQTKMFGDLPRPRLYTNHF